MQNSILKTCEEPKNQKPTFIYIPVFLLKMNKMLTAYLHSWSKWKLWSIVFLTDTAAFTMIGFLLYLFTQLMNFQGSKILGGMTPDELKANLISGTLENAQQFTTNVQFFALYFFFGMIAIVLVSLMILALSRSLLWNKIISRPFSWEKYWRWNVVIIISLLLLAPYLVVYLIIRLLINLFPIVNEAYFSILVQLVNYFFLLGFILMIFLIYYSFAVKYKVWESVGDAFSLLKKRRRDLGKLYVLIYLTGILFSFLLYLAAKLPFYWPSWAYTLISVAVFLLFLAWVRVYLVGTIIEAGPKPHQPPHGPEH